MKSISGMLQTKRLTFELAMLGVALILAGGLLGHQLTAARATGKGGLLTLVYLAACIGACAYVVCGVLRTLRWYEGILDALPASVSVLDRDLRCRYQNKPAAEAPDERAYEDLKETLRIPEGYVLAGDIRKSVVYGGIEYQLTIRPIGEKDEQGYLLVFNNIGEILDKQIQRAELMEEVGVLMQGLNQITQEYRKGSSALVNCTRKQAETMHQVAMILSAIFDRKYFDGEDLSKLSDAASMMNGCTSRGGQYAAQLAKTAGDIVKASHAIENTVKVMNNIL